ncbi:MAG: TetR/AcrR family transcriptional regulator [Bryobacteraceae bacterium]|nr:TetR/AcrR family transcriptional regulator [Bryobacteraceae bacterium]
MPENASTMPARRPASRRMLDSIYRAAADLIVEKGFEATTLAEVGSAVGLAKSGVYHHIKSKQDLLYDIMRHGMARLEQDVIEPARAVADPADRLRLLAERYAEFILGAEDGSGLGPRVTTLVHESRGLSPARKREIERARWRYYRFVRGAMQELADQGRFAEVNPTVAAMSFFGAMVWLAQWYRPGGELSRRQVIDSMVEMTAGLLIRRKPRPAKGKSRNG